MPEPRRSSKIGYGVILAIVVLSVWGVWWYRRPLGPVRTSLVVGRTALGGGDLGRVVVVNGGHPLTRDQKNLVARILQRSLGEWNDRSVRTGKLNRHLGFAVFDVERKGHRGRFRISALDGPEGATIGMRQLLVVAWTFNAGRPGQIDLPLRKEFELTLAGIRRDRAELEKAGITSFTSYHGDSLTWDEAERDLERRIAEEGREQGS